MSPYVERVLAIYRSLPITSRRLGPHDRQYAADLDAQRVPLETVECALLLAALRRLERPPDAPPLPPIRSLRYLAPILEELTHQPPAPGYRDYLAHRLRSRLVAALPPPPRLRRG